MPISRLPDGRAVVVLSAHTAELIRTDAAAVLRYLDREPTVEAVAAQLLRTRRIRRHRTVVRATDRDELATGLRVVAAGEDHPLVTRSPAGETGRLAFVFPGQGGQWPGMGAELYRGVAGYRSVADTCAAAFVTLGKPSPMAYLIGDGADTVGVQSFSETEIEGAQFVHAVALAHVWQACGIAPDLTVGHSLGEVAAAYLAGAITLPDAARVIAARAAVVDHLPGRYAVAALGIGIDDAHDLIAGIDGWLELSVVNTSASVAVSGDRDAVLAAVEAVASRGRFAREITVGFPVHTSILEPLRETVLGQLPDSEFADTAIQFVGAAIGDVVAPGTRFAGYWYGNLRDTVRFDRAIEAATRRGVRSFVEVSAHPALLYAISDIVGETIDADPTLLVGSGRRDRPLIETLSANIVTAAAADAGFDWRAVVDMAAPPLPGFPNAPMSPLHLWAQAEPLPAQPDLTVTVQQWRQSPLPAHASRAVAVHPAGAVALTDALARLATVTPPADAEILVVVAPAIDEVNAPAAANTLATLVGDGLLDYTTMIGSRCRTVCLVTTGAEQILSHDPLPSPGQAALAAMHRSIGYEHPGCNFVHVDLPAVGTDCLDAVAEAVLSEAGSGAVRADDGRSTWWRPTLADAPVGGQWALDDGLLDEVVITGGAGAVGLHYARYFAERGARRIILLSRRGADAATLAGIAGRTDTVIEAPPCDITDREALAAVAGRYGGNGASLLVHAAGTATFATAPALTSAVCADTCAAKITGLAQLTELWPLCDDARILLCSSVSGVWGGLGHGAYSAANRTLDVMAAQLRAEGRHCVALRWGLWQTAGTAIVDAAEIANIERSGLRAMPPQYAIEASLRDYPADPMVLSADPDRLRIFLTSQEPTPPADPTGTGKPAGLSTSEAVRRELASVLSLPDATTLDLDTELFNLGVDSLLAIDLRKRLKRVTGRTVPLATLLGGITGTELVSELGHDEAQKEALFSD